jgi:hypothetical protein
MQIDQGTLRPAGRNVFATISERAMSSCLKMKRLVAAIFCAVVVHTVHASPADVTVIDAQMNPAEATYTAPGYADSTAGHFDKIQGWIVALRLADGRVAVANCSSHLVSMGVALELDLRKYPCMAPPAAGSRLVVELTNSKFSFRWKLCNHHGHASTERYTVLQVLDAPPQGTGSDTLGDDASAESRSAQAPQCYDQATPTAEVDARTAALASQGALLAEFETSFYESTSAGGCSKFSWGPTPLFAGDELLLFERSLLARARAQRWEDDAKTIWKGLTLADVKDVKAPQKHLLWWVPVETQDGSCFFFAIGTKPRPGAAAAEEQLTNDFRSKLLAAVTAASGGTQTPQVTDN